ncbi:MAG: ATP-binding protein [Burkholderiales bacterium]
MLSRAEVMGSRLSLEIANGTAGLEAGQARLTEFLSSASIDPRATYQTELAFEELVTNILHYAYRDRLVGESSIQIGVQIEDDQVILRVEDDGPYFDPSQASEIALPTELETTTIGGFGLRLLRAAKMRIRHERVGGKNVVAVAIDRH